MKAYSSEWFNLGVDGRVDRLQILNEKGLGKRALEVWEFLWNFTANYKNFDKNTLEQL